MDRKYLLLASQMFGSPGGIQTFTRLVARVLLEDRACERIVSLADKDDDGVAIEWKHRYGFRWKGCGGSKTRFCIEAFRHAYYARWIIAGHIGLGSIAWLLKQSRIVEGYVIILHGVEAWKQLAWLESESLRRADRIICTTRYTASLIAALTSLEIGRFSVLPLALEPERFQSSETPLARDNSQFCLLTVARLAASEQYKGIDHVIQSLALVPNQEGLIYTVVGDGDDRPRLERLATNLGVAQHVRFVGHVSDEELRQLYQNAHVFVMPSKGEGFGLVYLEAMAYGVPIIASPEGGVPEVVEHEKTGLMVPYGDVRQLASSIQRLRSDDQLRQNMQLNSKRIVEERFSFDRFRCDLIRVLGVECTS